MPSIKSAIKRMKQANVRKARRLPLKNEMKTMVKKVLKLAKEGNAAEVTKLLPATYSVIDMAAKKKIIEQNTAARRKSRLARAANALTATEKA